MQDFEVTSSDGLAAIADVFRACASALRQRAGSKALDGASNLLLVAAHEAESAARSIDQAVNQASE